MSFIFDAFVGDSSLPVSYIDRCLKWLTDLAYLYQVPNVLVELLKPVLVHKGGTRHS
jgi:hypothetical protein